MKRTASVGLLGLAILCGCSATTAALPAPPVTVTVQPPITEPTVTPGTIEDRVTTFVATPSITSTAPAVSSPMVVSPSSVSEATTVGTVAPHVPDTQRIDEHATAQVVQWRPGFMRSSDQSYGELEVKVCISGLPAGSEVSGTRWNLIAGETGDVFAPSDEPLQDPQPAFPRLAYPIANDSCVQGWLQFTVPTGQWIQSIHYTRGYNDPQLVWRLTS